MTSTSFRAATPDSFGLPKRLLRLSELAYNFWWTWNPEAQRLFSLMDYDLWEEIYHNPVVFLRRVSQARVDAMLADRYYMDHYRRVFKAFDTYMAAEDTWFKTTYPQLMGKTIAYLSMEFGLHEVLPVYAGGLGVLSGDHVKEASDIDLPMVSVGLLYTQGYFSQRITEDGWQETKEFQIKTQDSPICPVLKEDQTPLMVSVELPGRMVQVRIWEVRVGRRALYLLDSNLESNNYTDRLLTARLYSSDLDVKISQRYLLAVAGARALRSLGYSPDMWHLNEGHAAFLGLELSRELIQQGMTFEEARLKLRKSNVFTIHTPIAAGNDEWPIWSMDQYFSRWWPVLGLTREQFLDLARNQQDWGATFSMPILAMRFAKHVNGVSELHGHVSRAMWQKLWPDRKVSEVPITHVTNGIHTTTWLARRMGVLFDRYLGQNWREHIDDPKMWEKVEDIPDQDLWRVRRHLKRKLVYYARERARAQWIAGKYHPVQVIAEGALLDPYALTIGFARRFAPYKRADLLLYDFERLLKLLNRSNQPVQIIYAGKSHPDHEQGKRLIQEVYRAVKLAENGGRLVFLEDYDMNLARYLTQGVDVWLNTPRRPREASGTSGEKAALNGVLNFSILDGWWCEAYDGFNGWSIGTASNDPNTESQDAADAASLYDTLENEIIPLYYRKRSSDGLPGDWIARMKACIRTISPQFSTRRMVKEYMNRLYAPSLQPEMDEED